MPIGVGTAVGIGGAVLGAGASIYGASKSAKAQDKAAQQAADTSLQVAQQNNDLFREIYGQDTALAAPYYNNGLLAGNALTDLLLGTHSYNPAIVANPTTPGGGTFAQFPVNPAPGAPGATPGYSGPGLGAIRTQGEMDAYLAYYRAHPELDPGFTSISQFHGDPFKDEDNASAVLAGRNAYLSSHPSAPATPAPGGALAAYSPPSQTPALVSSTPAAVSPAIAAVNARRAEHGLPPVGGRGGTAAGAGTVTASAPSTAQSAWDAFRNSTNYTWRYNQGLTAVDSGAAARGSLDSGATRKAEIEFGQNFAANELSNYMNLLASQQAAGLSAAGAVMGVGTNYAGNVAAQNTNAANAAANAALVAGQGKAGVWNSVANAGGQLGGALFQYGMGGYGGAPTVPLAGGYNVSTGAGSGTANYFAAHPFA